MIRRLLLACALTFAVAPVPPATPGEAEEPALDWVVYYYMAYDNNLSPWGPKILDMLAGGLTSKSVAVACSADFAGPGGMKRYVLTKDGRKETGRPEEGSADAATLAAELAWVRATLPAKRYAVVFLDHGGRLSEMSQDLHPAKPKGPRWLDLPEVAGVLERWRKTLPGRLDLVFLQQCGKGTLENYYALRKTAPVLMASQTAVGAPNAYYASTLRSLSADSGMDGKDLAAAIMAREAPNMFTTYTMVDSAALEALPARLDAVLKPLLARPGRLAIPAGPTNVEACFEFGPDERFFDAAQFLGALYSSNGLTIDPVEEFHRWVVETLVIGHRVSSLRTRIADRWCGLSVLLPLRSQALQRYEKHPLYRATRLDDLFLRLLP